MSHALDRLTENVIAVTTVLLIVYDVWVNWRRGGDSTLSWTVMVWSLCHPFLIVASCALIGHFFLPHCVSPSAPESHVSPLVGAFIGMLAIGVIACETGIRHTSPVKVPRPPAYSWARTLMLIMTGIAIGHFLFGQSMVCPV